MADTDNQQGTPNDGNEPQGGQPDTDSGTYITLQDGTQVSHDDAVKGYMKDQDYRSKTEELAKEREQLEGMTKFRDLLQSNPALAQRVASVLEEETMGKPVEPAAPNPNINPNDPMAGASVEQLSAMFGARLSDLEKNYATQEIDRQLSYLRQKYPGFNKKMQDATLDMAVKLKGADKLEDMYKVVAYDDMVTAAKEEGEQGVIKRLQERNEQQVDTGKGTSDSVSDSDVLTPMEKSFAKAMGTPEKDYLENKKKMQARAEGK